MTADFETLLSWSMPQPMIPSWTPMTTSERGANHPPTSADHMGLSEGTCRKLETHAKQRRHCRLQCIQQG